MAKRGNGEGSIYRRKNGRWYAAISLKTNSRKSKRHYFSAKTRKAAADWLTKQLHEQQLQNITTDSELTLMEWLQIWLDAYTPNIRPATRSNYSTYITKHIGASKLGNVPLRNVTVDQIQKFANNLQKSGKINYSGGLHPKTIRNLFNMLHAALKQAVGNGMISRNPVEYVVLPKTRSGRTRTLTRHEQELLLHSCGEERWRIGIFLLLFTGLRIGELLALRCSDLHLEADAPYLEISKSLQRIRDFDGNAEKLTSLQLVQPKTQNSIRKVPLIPPLVAALISHIDTLPGDDPFLICDECGRFVDPDHFRTWFRRIADDAGLEADVTPHVLRHTFATTLLENGVDLAFVSKILGHSSTSFTAATYIHTSVTATYAAIMPFAAFAADMMRKENCNVQK